MNCKVGEDPRTIEEVLLNIQERWLEVNQTMEERKNKVSALIEISRIHNESDAITRVLESHNKWLQSAENSVNIEEEVPKLMDQCKVFLFSLLLFNQIV